MQQIKDLWAKISANKTTMWLVIGGAAVAVFILRKKFAQSALYKKLVK